MAKSYCTNKYDVSGDVPFTGETRTVTRPDAAGIPPNKPRPEMVRKTRFARGQATGNPPGTPLYGA